MANRSIRRRIGDTSLERKCRWAFGVTLALLLAGSFWWYRGETDNLIAKGNEPLGEGLVGTALIEWHAQHLKSETEAQDNPDEMELWERLVRDLRSTNYHWYAILPQEKNHDKSEPRINPPESVKEWELHDRWLEKGRSAGFDSDEAIDQFEKNELESFGRSVARGDEHYYQYYRPIFAKNGCIDCHKAVGKKPNDKLQIGDLMAVMRVEVNEKAIIEAQRANFVILVTVAIVTAFLAMAALWVIVRYIIVKPLTHLRDVANAVRQGRVDQRADINTGDEFQELAAAFNRMLRRLLSQQDELLTTNATLDQNNDELAQANLRLFEMNKLKGDFLSTVSHELRTPLNSILGFSEVLAGLDSLTSRQKRYARNIQKSGKMLLEMIDDILDLAKIESGRMEVRPSDFRVESVLFELCDLARPLAEKKNIDVACEIPPGLPPIKQDQAKVQQILNNLLSNAIKFTPEGGTITVTAKRDELGDLRIVVADTGVGIGEEEQALVFEKFRQGTNVLPGGDAMIREYEGTGLGLSIVKELCRLLGGEITLESELGKGSTFCVRLPWAISEELRLDSELVEELDQLTRPLRSIRPRTSAVVSVTLAGEDSEIA